MKLTSLTAADFKKIQKLLTRKEKLAAQIARVDQQLEQFESGSTPKKTAKGRRKAKRKAKRAPAAKSSARRRRPRGQLQAKIISALKAAGSAGLHVKDIAAKVKRKDNHIRTWFYTTGKKVKNIKTAGPARYRWQD